MAQIFSRSILKLLHRRISIAFAVVFTGITQRSLQAYKIRFPSTPFGKHFLDRTPQNNFFSKCVFSTFAINIYFYALSIAIHVKRCIGDKNNITSSHLTTFNHFKDVLIYKQVSGEKQNTVWPLLFHKL